MKTSRVLLLLLSLTATTVWSEDWPAILREALFQEEAEGDLEAAKRGYASVVAHYETHRKLGATAVFRLAEVHRKQGEDAKAIERYRQILGQFSDQETLVTLARQNLTALNAEPAITSIGTDDVEGISPAEAQVLASLKQLISESPDLINQRSEVERNTPLHQAAQLSHLHAAAFLLDHGADLEALSEDDEEGMTPLEMACLAGHKAMVKLLIEHGAKVGPNALKAAIRGQRRSIVNLLLEEDIDVNAFPSVHFAVVSGDLSVVEKLLNHGADRDATPDEHQTPFLAAVARDRKDMVDLFLAQGVDINEIYRYNSPLMQAISARVSKEMIEHLIAAGADVNLANSLGFTALMSAGWNHQEGLIEYLLESGAEVNAIAKDDEGNVVDTPLFALIRQDSFPYHDIIRMIEAGADLNQRVDVDRFPSRDEKTFNGGTPFHKLVWYAFRGLSEVERRMLTVAASQGANPNLKTRDGETAWDLVKKTSASRPMKLREMARIFLYPDVVTNEAVYVSLPENQVAFATLQQGDSPQANPAFTEALLPVKRYLSNLQQEGITPRGDYCHLVRQQEDGRFVEIERIHLDAVTQGSESLPSLRWGDVIEFTSEDFNSTRTTSQTSSSDKWLPELSRNASFFRRYLPLKIKLTYHDKTWELQASRFGIEDPGSKVTTASSVYTLIRPLIGDPQLDLSEVIIDRLPADGGDRFSFTSEAKKSYFSLNEGDHIKLTSLEDEADSHAKRTEGIFVSQVGTRYFQKVYHKHGHIPFSPTLYHLICAVFDNDFLVLPHPNFSKIVIDRLASGDTPKQRLEVDLYERIEQNAQDVNLQFGDIVEIPRLTDVDSSSWSGLDERVRLFLTSQISFTMVQKLESIEPLRFAPRFYHYSSKDGVWTRELITDEDEGVDIYGLDHHPLIKEKLERRFENWKLVRGGQRYVITRDQISSRKIWLQEGDLLEDGVSTRSTRTAVVPNSSNKSSPRRRVVLPPSLK